MKVRARSIRRSEELYFSSSALISSTLAFSASTKNSLTKSSTPNFSSNVRIPSIKKSKLSLMGSFEPTQYALYMLSISMKTSYRLLSAARFGASLRTVSRSCVALTIFSASFFDTCCSLIIRVRQLGIKLLSSSQMWFTLFKTLSK